MLVGVLWDPYVGGCIASCCNMLPCVAAYRDSQQDSYCSGCVTVCLPRVAVRYNVLQCVAIGRDSHQDPYCGGCVAVCCNVS